MYEEVILQITFGLVLVMCLAIGKHRKRTVFHHMFCICSWGFTHTPPDPQKIWKCVNVEHLYTIYIPFCNGRKGHFIPVWAVMTECLNREVLYHKGNEGGINIYKYQK